MTASFARSARSADAFAPVETPHAVLEASGLTVGWDGRPVLHDIHLSVRSGERIALVGSNGSGKTTLLRVLAGLLAPLAGALTWMGGPLPKGALRCKVTGFVLQSEPPAHFTVRQLLTLGLGTDGPPSAWQAQKVTRLMEDEGLVELASRPCASLSGGEWQRTAIARALVSEPALLFLDEPTNHLDPARRALLHERLERLQQQAVILATHDLELAVRCDRVMLLGEQRALAVGRPAEVLTPSVLARSLGVRVRRVDDPRGGPSLFRILGAANASFAGEES